jgi:hypothetical protein
MRAIVTYSRESRNKLLTDGGELIEGAADRGFSVREAVDLFTSSAGEKPLRYLYSLSMYGSMLEGSSGAGIRRSAEATIKPETVLEIGAGAGVCFTRLSIRCA